MFNRENAIGSVLLLLCAVVAAALLFSIATGTQFRFDGPGWIGTALVILFIGASIWGFVKQPGRRWPWDRNKEINTEDRTRDL
jgi:hypothetical protein